MNFKNILRMHLNNYPIHEHEDMYKMIYQSVFAGGHLIQDISKHFTYLKQEAKDVENAVMKPMESISNQYRRVYLDGILKSGLALETLQQMILNTAENNHGNQSEFEARLDDWKTLEDASDFIASMKAQDYPLVHHSERYKKAYHPAYRIIANEYAFYMDLFETIDQQLKLNKTVVVAIDGDAGSGKSELAKLLHTIYKQQTIRMDDFFLQDHQRTKERLKEIGGHVDYERFYQKVIKPLKKQSAFTYQSYDCQTHDFDKTHTIKPYQLIVVEGSYSLREEFREVYDIKAVLHVSPEVQLERLNRRNPKLLDRFKTTWIPKEKAYAKTFKIDTYADFIFNTDLLNKTIV